MGVLTFSGCCRVWARLAAPSKPPTGTELRGHQQTQPHHSLKPWSLLSDRVASCKTRMEALEGRAEACELWLAPSSRWGCWRPLALGVELSWWTCGALVGWAPPASLAVFGPAPTQPARLLCLWNSPGQNTGVVSHSLLQGMLQTQGSNPDLLHCTWTLYHLSHHGSLYLYVCMK